MGNNLDNGFGHENKRQQKGLKCPPLSGFNHLAIYLRWAYEKGFILDEVFKKEPRLKPAMEGKGDLREVIADSSYLKGRMQSYYFTEEFKNFSEWFYQDYCGCVDDYAENYFGTERYNSDEFQDEAYLFVPYNEEYYRGLSKYIDDNWENKPPKLSGESIGREKLDDILKTIREKTETEVVLIRIENGQTSLTGSKIGGYPYWPAEMEYPVDSNGNKLVLLAQINFADIRYGKLPDKGLLQFFVAFDDVLGLEKEKGYKVVYHENIDSGITEDDVKNRGIQSNVDLKEEFFMFPTELVLPLSFSVQKDYLKERNDGFDKIASRILKEKYGYNCRDLWKFLSTEDYNYLSKDDPEHEHKMFGYPFFTQNDPRTYLDSEGKYDTLLFQLDSEYNEDFGGTEIGDGGVINFFINGKDLENLNFEDVLYWWDCF